VLIKANVLPLNYEFPWNQIPANTSF
jgi:hypothetical protein